MNGTKRQRKPKTDKLTPAQVKAVAALLASPTLKAAAEGAGLSERTVQRYMLLPHFRQALAQAESEAMAEAARRLAVDAGNAALVLKGIMNDPAAPAAARVNAARAWLQLTPGFREHAQLEARISELEKRLSNEAKPTQKN